MRPSWRSGFGVAVLAVGWAGAHSRAVAQAAGDTLACRAPAADARPLKRAPLAAGAYRLAVVITGPDDTVPVRPAVTGQLWLWRASPSDRSPRTRERAHDEVWGRAVAYTGATDAPLARLFLLDSLGITPLTSRDPVYPGVVVVHPGAHAPWELQIGANNDRSLDPAGITDGPVAVLAVERADRRGGFSGPWTLEGRIRAQGYFCARYVGPAPRR